MHRVNIMVDEPNWKTLRTVPKGERSRVINTALEKWFVTERRKAAVEQMDHWRSQLPSVSTQEILTGLRKDRERQA